MAARGIADPGEWRRRGRLRYEICGTDPRVWGDGTPSGGRRLL